MDTQHDKMKVLVTGAKGQLGFKINELLGSKYDLVLTDVDSMDITNEAMVRAVLEREKPDFVIHGAAYTRVDLAEENRELCYRINVTGTENVARAARDLDITLVYISTDFVFDGGKKTPYTEEDAAKPLSYYGETKYLGEEVIRKSCQKYYILRIAWLFGELPQNYPGTNFVETMLKLAADRDSLSVVDDQVGSPTYTADLVEIMDRLLGLGGYGNEARIGNEGRLRDRQAPDETGLVTEERPTVPFGTYHFSGTGECSWCGFAREIFSQAGVTIELKPISSDEYPQKAKRPSYSYMDKTKIEEALGITVRPWQEMLKSYLDRRGE